MSSLSPASSTRAVAVAQMASRSRVSVLLVGFSLVGRERSFDRGWPISEAGSSVPTGRLLSERADVGEVAAGGFW